MRDWSIMRILSSLLLVVTIAGCSAKSSTPVVVTAAPQIVSIAGGSITIVAKDAPIILSTQEILDDSDNPVVDGTGFLVTGSPDIQVSVDGVNYSDSIKVASLKSIITFKSKPSTQSGTYKIAVTQIQKQQRNATGFFYIVVNPSTADNIGQIVSSRFEDLPPYNGVKDSNEKYSALADGTTPVTLTVGPIIDSFGNTVNSGNIRIIADRGIFVSNNPASISDGFAIFSYLPTTVEGAVNLKAQAVDESSGTILKEQVGIIYQVKPKLQFGATEDLGDFVVNTTKTAQITLSNVGSTTATGIRLSTNQPFQLPSASTDCTILHAGESCTVNVSLTAPARALIGGTVSAQALPTIISENFTQVALSARAIDPSSIAVSTNSMRFNSSCGVESVKQFYLQNNGQLDATNFKITSPTAISSSDEILCSAAISASSCKTVSTKCRWSSTSVCTSQPFDVIVAPADYPIPASGKANCGTTIPAGGVQCLVTVKFEPTTLIPSYLSSVAVSADGLTPQTITLGGVAGVGIPAGTIPISLNKTALGILSADQATVTIGPVKDVCGNPLTSDSNYTVSVTAGSTNKTGGTFAAGLANLTWTSSMNVADLGNQTMTVKTGTITGTATVPFNGVSVAISGPTNIGEVNADTPQMKYWTVTNSGNQPTNISVTVNGGTPTTPPVNMNLSDIDVSQCQNLAGGISCQLGLLLLPNIPTNSATTNFSGTINILGTGVGKLTDALSFTGSGTKIIRLSGAKTLNYDMGNIYAGAGFTRVVTLVNDSSSTVSSLSISFASGTTATWSTTNNTCAAPLSVNSKCTFTLKYSTTDTVAGNKQAQMSVSTNVGTTTINYTLAVLGNVNQLDTIPVSSSVPSIPADGSSTATITVGPIKDSYPTHNLIPAGTAVTITTSIGSILEPQPLYTDAFGKVTATIKASKVVGNSSVTASVGSIIGTNTVIFSGVTLGFEPKSFDFGALAMGNSLDQIIVFRNSGNTDATGLNFSSSDTTAFTITDLGTCQSGTLSWDTTKGNSCNILVRYTAPAATLKTNISADITVTSSNTTGTTTADLPVKGINLLPATLMASKKNMTFQLIPKTILVTQATIYNLGDDIIRNFTIQTDKPNYVSLTNYDACNNLAGNSSCTVTITLNPQDFTEKFSSIITLSADKTSTSITLSADKVYLSFANTGFNDNVFTCHSINVETQDSNGNPMILESPMEVGLASSRTGAYYRNPTCAGQAVVRTNIFANASDAEQLYYIPRLAGKHTLTISNSDSSIVKTQDELANLVLSPGSSILTSPMGPVQITAIGAVGNVSCSFTLNATQGSVSATGKLCNYQAGNTGTQTDFIILSDGDTPPNTAAIQVTTGPKIQISPLYATVDSGGQASFSASLGSTVGYSFSSAPQGTKKIGSAMFGNIFAAGQNVTGSDLRENVIVSDSFGSTATATVVVHPSIFKEEATINNGTVALKNVSTWLNTILVGDPTASFNGIAKAGAVYVYKYDTIKKIWNLTATINSSNPIVGGAFGTSVGLFRNEFIVGAPGETPYVGLLGYGNAYHGTLTDAGVANSDLTSVIPPISKVNRSETQLGLFVSITSGYIAVANSQNILLYPAGSITNTRDDINCKQAPCPDFISEADTLTSLSIYANDIYGGAYLAAGYSQSSFGSAQNVGTVYVYKNSGGGDWNPGVQRITEDASLYAANDYFGASVSIYGPFLAIGAPGKTIAGKANAGQVFVYKRDMFNSDSPVNNNIWTIPKTLNSADYNLTGQVAGMNFGSAVAIQGNYLAIGASGQQNYPYASNDQSGSMYFFQRYLSEDNSWEYLGQVRSTQYAANDKYGQNVSVYGNEFYTTDAKGNVFHVTGGKQINAWPFGYHGIFDLAAGATLNIDGSNYYRDFSSVRTEVGSVIVNDTPNNYYGWMIWGVAGEVVWNGAATGRSTLDTTSFNSLLPSTDGYLDPSKQLNYTLWRGEGGSGGRSSACRQEHQSGNFWHSGHDYFHCKGSWPAYFPGGVCGNGGAGTGDYVNSDGPANCSQGGDGGTGGESGNQVRTGYGATTWSGQGAAGIDTGVWGGGGGGGFKGRQGSLFYITAAKVSGTGTFDVQGEMGGDGGRGGGGSSYGGNYGGGNIDVCWQQYCSLKAGLSSGTSINDYSCYCTATGAQFASNNTQCGGGGGGGGGAGGSAGAVYVFSQDKTTNFQNTAQFNSSYGRGGAGGFVYCLGANSTISQQFCGVVNSYVARGGENTGFDSCRDASVSEDNAFGGGSGGFYKNHVLSFSNGNDQLPANNVPNPGASGSNGAAGRACINCQ